MKGLTSCAAAALLLCLPTLVYPAAKSVKVTVYYAKVTKAPSSKAPVVGVVQQGDQYPLITVAGDWVKIRFSGEEGWISSDKVVLGPPFKKPAPRKPQASTSTSTARREPQQAQSSVRTTSTVRERRRASSSATTTHRVAVSSSPTTSSTVRAQARKSPKPDRSGASSQSPSANGDAPATEEPAQASVAQEQTTKYVQITKPALRVLKHLDPQSPIIGMAQSGKYYRLIEPYESWVKISFDGTTGFVERRYVRITEKADDVFLKQLRENALLIVIAALVIALLAIAARLIAARRGRVVSVQRNALIIAEKEKIVQYAMTNTSGSIDRCFAEIGFRVQTARDLAIAQGLIMRSMPDLILVDWQFSDSIGRDVEVMLTGRSSTSSIPVIFYNVPDPGNVNRLRKLPNVHYMGISLTDRDIFKVVTPLVITGEKKKVIHKSVQASALEGELGDGGLSPVFQFIEVGNKTGCLLVRRGGEPYGVVYVSGARISYATTNTSQGQHGVMELLALRDGDFRFIAGKQPSSTNCNVSIMEALMESARLEDEAHRDRLRQT